MIVQAEVQIPRWPQYTLGEVATIERRIIDAAEICDGTMYVGLEHIARGGNFVNVGSVASGELSSTKFAFTRDHILYGKLRPYLAKIARPDFDGVCSTDILPILPGSDVNRDYLTHFLRLPAMVQLANSRATGANLPRISPRELATFEIPVPPLPEQIRIATVLDKTESLRVKRRETLARLDELTQATFLGMFGDLPTNPCGWRTRTCQDVCQKITVGIVVRPASYYQESGIPALRSLNILPNQVSTKSLVYFSPQDNETRLAKTRVRAGDVVLVRSGQPGTAAVIPDELDGVNSIDILIATPDQSRIHPIFMSYYFNSTAGKRGIKGEQRGQIQQHLNVGSLKSSIIPVPPLVLQHDFVRHVKSIEGIKKTCHAHLAELDALFASLQYRAFRGEL